MFFITKSIRRTILFIFWTPLLLFKPALAITPLPPEDIRNEEADRLLPDGEWKNTIDLHQKVIKRNPNIALAHYYLGFAFGQIDKYDQEVAEYRKAISLGLKNSPAAVSDDSIQNQDHAPMKEDQTLFPPDRTRIR